MNKAYLNELLGKVTVGTAPVDPTVLKELESNYDIKELLGEGTCSIVKRGFDRKTGEAVAIKIIKKDQLAKTHQEDLLREMQILTKVSHPHIIELKAVYDTGSELYIVMELMEGGMLFDRIVEKGSYTESDARELVRALCSAVQHLHSQNIIHRDLKPENLLMKSIDDDTSVKIADFGLSKIIDQERMLLTACGTPAYVAPEILLAQGYDQAVDLWCIGVIAYILLCGFPPFSANGLPQLLEKIITADFDYPSNYWDEVSDLAKDFVERLLVLDPKNRMTAQEALQHAWLQEEAKTDNSLSKVKELMKQTVEERKESRLSQLN